MKIRSMLLLLLLAINWSWTEKIPDKSKRLVISGVAVEFIVDQQTFPESWKTEEINAKGVSLDPVEMERSIRIVKKALGKYPQSVLSENLKKIYILKSIEFYNGVGFGGTNSTDVVYITNDGTENGYTDEYIETVVHHEFSSILLRNYPEFLDETEWLNANQLEYGSGGVDAIRDGTAGKDYDESLMEAGFLVQYATSDMENDFNVFAENMFCSGQFFWDYCDRYKRINRKTNLMIEFYKKLSPEFTRTYFVSVSQQ